MMTQITFDGTIKRHRIDCTRPQLVDVLDIEGRFVPTSIEVHRDHVIVTSCVMALGEEDKAIPAGDYKIHIVEHR